MTESDVKLLEDLLGKASTSAGGRIVVATGHIQDGYYLGVFDHSGKKLKEFSVPSLLDVTELINK